MYVRQCTFLLSFHLQLWQLNELWRVCLCWRLPARAEKMLRV